MGANQGYLQIRINFDNVKMREKQKGFFYYEFSSEGKLSK